MLCESTDVTSSEVRFRDREWMVVPPARGGVGSEGLMVTEVPFGKTESSALLGQTHLDWGR